MKPGSEPTTNSLSDKDKRLLDETYWSSVGQNVILLASYSIVLVWCYLIWKEEISDYVEGHWTIVIFIALIFMVSGGIALVVNNLICWVSNKEESIGPAFHILFLPSFLMLNLIAF
jgi:hypothetical protein